MKRTFFSVCCCLAVAAMSAASAASFNPSKDILIAQFDGRPDADDLHSQAALGSLLQHSDFAGVQAYGVMGAYGEQNSRLIWDSSILMGMVFGNGNSNWTNAHAEYASSVQRIANKTEVILNGGGHVWVQEAGQSNITADWLRELKSRGFSGANLRNGVTVVQHSNWNENQTKASDLDYVKNNSNYLKIADGNSSNNGTPDYQSDGNRKIAEHAQLLADAKSSSRNANAATRAMWREADRLIDEENWSASYSPIDEGGLDFSDCVENWYIFELGTRANTIENFWARYVVSDQTGGEPTSPALSLSTTSVSVGENITFDGSASTGDIEWYRFYYGDGSKSDRITADSITYSYSAPGTYEVYLKIKGADGERKSTATQTIVVTDDDPGAGGELALLDDAFVNVNNGGRNYDGRELKITNKTKKCIYLKFDTSGYSGSHDAILSLHCIDPGRGKIDVFVADGNFNEEVITYDNQPGYSGASLGSINQSYAAGSDYFINLSGVPMDGSRVSLVLVIEGSGAQSAYDSKETNEVNKPLLEVVGGGAG